MDWKKFLDKIFADVFKLMEETHDYIKWQEPIDVEALKCEADRDCLQCETAKMSVYLIQIMAWLLTRQSAMANGSRLVEQCEFDKPVLFLVEAGVVPRFMPKKALMLSRKILGMYNRVNWLHKIATAAMVYDVSKLQQ
ncbi:MAG: DUF1465 family protein [Holosporales bacterium]|jgi:hypothetical protein|nr:DUF1465 family protein [Holosporales bacterium]